MDYLNYLLEEMETAKTKGRKTIYRMNQTITPEDIKIIQDYFIYPTYNLVLKQCKLYENSWDVMLTGGD